MIGLFILLFILLGVIVLILGWILSSYLLNVYENEKSTWDMFILPVEKLIYRVLGVDTTRQMSWKEYFLALFFFTGFAAILAYLVLVFQGYLPLNPMRFHNLNWSLALNTVLSFSSNTNLQHYGGGSTLSYFSQMMAIQFLQFISAADGVVVALAIFRGFAGKKNGNDGIGNFYFDFVRTITRVLIPLSFVSAIILIALGVPQSLSGYEVVRTFTGAFQTIKVGPIASMQSIMQIGTNGGGYFGSNNYTPFENPSPLTDFMQMGMMMLIPTAMPFLFGRMLRRRNEGRTVLIASYGLYAIDLAIAFVPLTVISAGMEVRFGGPAAVFYTVTTTAFTTGSVNAALAGMHPLVVLAAFLGMMIQATPGGIGVGAMYMLMYMVITVFIVGLMAGRTPEYLGAKITEGDVKLAVIAFLAHPILILVPTLIAYGIGAVHGIGIGTGPKGFTQILYEYTSAAANNGSDFLGSTGNTVYFNVSTGIVMWIGRFTPIAIMLAIAGRMHGRKRSREVALRTDNFIFPSILIVSIFILAVLTFFPFLAIGPILMHLEGIKSVL
ncbi:hypothetical protein IX51_02795 [uncultured archaeon]|nr:hypothetical protein IX51_02795 [uncultured archaeon]